MWFFVVLLTGQVLTSVLLVADTEAESKAGCIYMMNVAYKTMNLAYDENPYGIANHTGAIFRRHQWEFKCVK